jgi:type I restriction enzyme S subunit
MKLVDGWRCVKFGELVANVNDYFDRDTGPESRVVAGQNLSEHDLTISTWTLTTDHDFRPTFKRRFRSGDALFHSRNVEKLGVPDFDGVTGEKIFVLRSKDQEQLLQSFLPWVLLSTTTRGHVARSLAGSVNKFLNWTPLARMEFGLPPIDEQHRIAELLWATEDLRRLTLRLQRSAKVALATRLSVELSAARSDVKLVPVEELIVEGPRNGHSAQSNDAGRGVKTLAIGAIRGGKVVALGSTKYAEVDQSVLQSFPLRRDDIFVVRGNGNKMLTGRAGIVEQDLEGYIYPDLLIKLRFDRELIDPRFACIVWNLPQVHGSLIRRAKSTNGIWKINGKDIKQHVLPVPPSAKQSQILRQLAILEDASEAAAEQRKNVGALLSSLIAHTVDNGLH